MERQPSARLAAARQLRDLASECRDHAADFGPALLRLLGDSEAGGRRWGLDAAAAILGFAGVAPLLRARAWDPSPVIRAPAIGLKREREGAAQPPQTAGLLQRLRAPDVTP